MRQNKLDHPRASLLKEIEDLPETAFVSARYAAALLDSSPSVLANWRSQRRGPPYCGNRTFIRYRLSDLYAWIAAREGETLLIQPQLMRPETLA